jgi:hypothetical protein
MFYGGFHQSPVLWRGGDVADNLAWRCIETRCNYSVQQRGELRQDDDRPGLPRSDVLVSSHGLVCRWREIRACNDNACGESKSQNFHESFLNLTFLIAATDPKALIY